MDAITEMYYRNRSDEYMREASSFIDATIKAEGKKKEQGIKLISLLLRASIYQNELLELAQHYESKMRMMDYDRAVLEEKLENARKMNKELKRFMTHE